MHELSIAMSIAELALAEAQKAKAVKVKEIEVEVGDWSGVDYDALQFSLTAVLNAEAVLKETKLNMIRRTPVMHCKECNCDFTPTAMYITQCETCGGEAIELKQGKELSLLSLIIED